MEVLAPIIVTLALVAIPIVALISAGVRKYREREMRHRERMRALELGIELPPDSNDPKPRNGNRSNPALHGSIWTALGAGFLATRSYVGDLEGTHADLLEFATFLSIWALPMLFVGLGLLLYAWITSRSKKSE